jgi:LysR family transcriptional regulator, transcriptional activator of nhaA
MQRLNHHHLFIFWTFATAGSFTKTASQLAIAQSAVTAQIKQLEDALGLQLIDRSNRRRPELTSDGRRVLEYATSIFETSQELLKWATRGEAPKVSPLRIGALSGLSRNFQYEFLKPIIGDDRFRIEVTTADQEQLVSLLRSHSLDAILSSHNVRSDGNTSFYSHVLTASPVIFVTGRGKAGGKQESLRQALETRPLYVPGPAFEARPELDAFLEKFNRPLRIAGEIDDIALLRILALRSGALVAMPEMGVKAEIEQKEVILLGRAENVEQRFYAITRQKRLPHRTIEELIKKAKKS